eukprot:4917679-Amphidinium_carterae.1
MEFLKKPCSLSSQSLASGLAHEWRTSLDLRMLGMFSRTAWSCNTYMQSRDRALRGLVAIDYEGVDSAARPICSCDESRRILAQDLEEIDHLAWVLFETLGCQGWFPVACLQDAGMPSCHCSLLPHSGQIDLNKVDMVGLTEVVPSSAGMTTSQTASGGLHRATLDESAATKIGTRRP